MNTSTKDAYPKFEYSYVPCLLEAESEDNRFVSMALGG
jgi:hypothetical protein